MCVNFFIFDYLRIKIQSWHLIWGTKFRAPSLLLLPLSFSSFKLLSMASYGGELVLDSSSPWSGVSNYLSSFSIPLPLNFKKQRTLLLMKIQGLQAPLGATSYSFLGRCMAWTTALKCRFERLYEMSGQKKILLSVTLGYGMSMGGCGLCGSREIFLHGKETYKLPSFRN